MSGIQQTLLGGSPAGYQIERSLRFNSADGAYLNRTFGTPTDNKKWTFSAWIKVSDISSGINRTIFSGDANDGGTNFCFIRYNSLNQIDFRNMVSGVDKCFVNTTAVFRDPSAYFHLQFVFDSGNATQANRQILYINGTSVGLTGTLSTLNDACSLNVNGRGHRIGELQYSTSLFGGYMTEVNFIDGQALTPSSFGQTNASTGVWEPVKYTGTYGTNGFYLNFSDNSNTTSTTLGKDSSGNGNNWTPNLFSVTAGAGNDSLVDTPTSYGTDTGVGGEVRGNYATLNPNDKNSGITLSNGNLDASMPTQSQNVYGTMSVTSGKWYWETTINSLSGRVIIGVGNTVDQSWNLDPSSSSALWGYYSVNGNKLNGSNTAYGNSFTAGNTIGVAVDMDSGKIWFSKDGAWQASGDPAAGTNAAFTNLTGSVRPMYNQQLTNAVTLSCNFGQRPFAYTAPSGFKALCTQNLPTPTIGATSTTQANDYMNVVLYTGNGGTAQDITGVGFQPDFVWLKSRNSGSFSHRLYDAVRGAGKELYSNADVGESTVAQSLTAFISDGFSLGTDTNNNATSTTYVAWNWKANGAGSSNTAGTITSTVSANTTAGFSIATFTMPASGTSDTVGHGLGVAPAMVIVKSRGSSSWGVYHKNLTSAAYYLRLQTTDGETSSNSYWNSTAPTSTVFTLGATWYGAGTMVAYSFAEVAGYSAFGKYTGNGSTDGPFVFTGFRPRFVLRKRTDAAWRWFTIDSSRDTFNVGNDALFPNYANAEEVSTTNWGVDFLSNGFKVRSTDIESNASGGTYIYMAFAESPFKFSLAR